MKFKKRYWIPTAIFFVFVFYGVAIEPYWLDIQKVDTPIPNLPPEWEGHRIAVFSDFQIGMWMDNVPTARAAVRGAIDEDVAAVLFAGDFLFKARNDGRDQIGQAVEVMRPLTEAGIPVYAVLGNHDYAVNWPGEQRAQAQIEELMDRMGEIGVIYLRNENMVLESPKVDSQGLYVVGLDSIWADLTDANKALEGLPNDAARIVIAHNPGAFKLVPAKAAPFAIVGHTHGGQIRIPIIEERDLLGILQDGELNSAGWTEEDFGNAGNSLYVTRGIGFSGLPIRINARPELTILILESR